MNYSLQANKKTEEGEEDHPDRNAQFYYINTKTKKFQNQSQPVISVDTKKKRMWEITGITGESTVKKNRQR